jgi:hypothetical protein
LAYETFAVNQPKFHYVIANGATLDDVQVEFHYSENGQFSNSIVLFLSDQMSATDSAPLEILAFRSK